MSEVTHRLLIEADTDLWDGNPITVLVTLEVYGAPHTDASAPTLELALLQLVDNLAREMIEATDPP